MIQTQHHCWPSNTSSDLKILRTTQKDPLPRCFTEVYHRTTVCHAALYMGSHWLFDSCLPSLAFSIASISGVTSLMAASFRMWSMLERSFVWFLLIPEKTCTGTFVVAKMLICAVNAVKVTGQEIRKCPRHVRQTCPSLSHTFISSWLLMVDQRSCEWPRKKPGSIAPTTVLLFYLWTASCLYSREVSCITSHKDSFNLKERILSKYYVTTAPLQPFVQDVLECQKGAF